MAYKQNPGRKNHAKTGHGIPEVLLQTKEKGFFDSAVDKVKQVGKAISHADEAGDYSFDQSRKSANFAGDFGGGGSGSGRSYTKNPIDYVTGFASDIISGGKGKTWKDAKKGKK